jgi:hypothetical protein
VARAPTRLRDGYQGEYAGQARALAVCGEKDAKIAEYFQVDIARLHAWKTRYPEFHAAIHYGREQAKARVVTALLDVATGYSHETIKIYSHRVKSSDGNETIEITQVPITEKFAPSVDAIKFFLTNRDPENWKNRQNTDLSGSVELRGDGISALLAAARAAKSEPTA